LGAIAFSVDDSDGIDTLESALDAVPSASQDAAIALGRHMLDAAVVPSGAKPFAGRAPSSLHAPLQYPGIRNLAFGHRH